MHTQGMGDEGKYEKEMELDSEGFEIRWCHTSHAGIKHETEASKTGNWSKSQDTECNSQGFENFHKKFIFKIYASSYFGDG